MAVRNPKDIDHRTMFERIRKLDELYLKADRLLNEYDRLDEDDKEGREKKRRAYRRVWRKYEKLRNEPF